MFIFHKRVWKRCWYDVPARFCTDINLLYTFTCMCVCVCVCVCVFACIHESVCVVVCLCLFECKQDSCLSDCYSVEKASKDEAYDELSYSALQR